MEETIEIGAQGIKNALKKYNAQSAIAEYVWNSFDAGAENVYIGFEKSDLGAIEVLWVGDDGKGINSPDRFKPFHHKMKIIDPDVIHRGPSGTHGKNGIGRLTFFKFAQSAKWETTYQSKTDGFKTYTLNINSANLNKFSYEPEAVPENVSGTVVTFSGIWELTESHLDELRDYLEKEFAWFLELGSPHARTLWVEGCDLDYKNLIGERKEFELKINDQIFVVRYMRWKESLRNEYSRYYFIGSDGRERAKQTTTLNNKGDGFFHSVYVRGAYFDSLKGRTIILDNDLAEEAQPSLFQDIDQDATFRELIKKLDDFLRSKRSPFLRKQATKFTDGLEKDGIYPHFGIEQWEQRRKETLTEVVREIYEADPRIFNGLNKQQKQTLIRLFSLVMDSSEREHLLEVLSQVVNLESRERADLAKILLGTKLSNVISTIKLIEDRFLAVNELKNLVFNRSFGANERDHLQTHIERHYWLFGEQYHLATSAEPDFEQALRRHVYLLRGVDEQQKIDHPDKNKEMDVFAVRWLPNVNQINNIVLELKHPLTRLSKHEFEQVKTYMNVILKEPRFNAGNMTWEFYLIGNDYDEYIAGELENSDARGEKHLAFSRPKSNYKIYVMKWSEVITNFELRHNFLLEKLKFEREKLASQAESADEILANGHRNSAALSQATQPIV